MGAAKRSTGATHKLPVQSGEVTCHDGLCIKEQAYRVPLTTHRVTLSAAAAWGRKDKR